MTVTVLDELFDRYVGIALARQCALADSVPDPYWTWEYSDNGEKGTVKIPSLGEFDVQFLGSESYISNSWLAAWANQSVSNGFTNASQWMHDNIDKLGDFRLGEEYVPLDQLNGDYVGVIATTLLNASAYFVLPVGEGAGASFQVIFDVPLINFAPTPLNRINTIMQMIEQSTQVTSMSIAMDSYLEDEGFQCTEEDTDDGFRKIFKDAADRLITFDYKEIEDNGELFYQVTRNMQISETERPISPDHFDVRAQWDAFIRAPLSRPVSLEE